jgi:hypothetical protein
MRKLRIDGAHQLGGRHGKWLTGQIAGPLHFAAERTFTISAGLLVIKPSSPAAKSWLARFGSSIV